MKEQRPRIARITVRLADDSVRAFSIFDAEEWPERNGPAGLLRVQDGEKWVSRDGSKYDWHSPEAVGLLLARLLREQLGTILPEPHIPPDTPAGTRVRVRTPAEVGRQFTTHTRSAPFERDGQWKVFVLGYRYPLPLECVNRVRDGPEQD